MADNHRLAGRLVQRPASQLGDRPPRDYAYEKRCGKPQEWLLLLRIVATSAHFIYIGSQFYLYVYISSVFNESIHYCVILCLVKESVGGRGRMYINILQ